MAGAPEGNDNSYRGSIIRGAIRRELNERSKQGRDSLRITVGKMIDDAEEGDKEARREFFDRLDGKAAQSLTVAGDAENPLQIMQWPLPKSPLDRP